VKQFCLAADAAFTPHRHKFTIGDLRSDHVAPAADAVVPNCL
jgi:hypothetical protein